MIPMDKSIKGDRAAAGARDAVYRSPVGFGLLDLMLLVGLEGRTGEMVIESGNNIGSLLFHEGKILLAFSPYTRAMGDLLVEQGMITDAELLEMLKEQRTGPHTPVGAMLLRSGKVTLGTIEGMVHEQIRKAIRDFQAWDPAEFSFVGKPVKPFDAIHLQVYEFLPADIAASCRQFLSGMPAAPGIALNDPAGA
jgi:hypothetical protein